MTCGISYTLLLQLLNVYHRILALPSLVPSPKVNEVFSELVALCLQIKVPSDHLNAHLVEASKKDNISFDAHSLISRAMAAEDCMERYWADILAKSDNVENVMHSFWYWENYATLIKYELDSLKAAGCLTFQRVAFVGSGPLPITAFLIAQETKSRVVLYDKDPDANDLAANWIRKLPKDKGVDSGQFSFRDINASHVTPEEFAQYDIIWLAASVGMDGKEKGAIIRHIRRGMKPGSFLAIRSVEMGCSLLYPEIRRFELGDVNILRHDVPPQGVVNSVIVLRA